MTRTKWAVWIGLALLQAGDIASTMLVYARHPMTMYETNPMTRDSAMHPVLWKMVVFKFAILLLLWLVIRVKARRLWIYYGACGLYSAVVVWNLILAAWVA
jgi:Domain of unknown function (DUF5658)